LEEGDDKAHFGSPDAAYMTSRGNSATVIVGGTCTGIEQAQKRVDRQTNELGRGVTRDKTRDTQIAGAIRIIDRILSKPAYEMLNKTDTRRLAVHMVAAKRFARTNLCDKEMHIAACVIYAYIQNAEVQSVDSTPRVERHAKAHETRKRRANEAAVEFVRMADWSADEMLAFLLESRPPGVEAWPDVARALCAALARQQRAAPRPIGVLLRIATEKAFRTTYEMDATVAAFVHATVRQRSRWEEATTRANESKRRRAIRSRATSNLGIRTGV